jgi:hypothetical protein
MKRVIRRIVTVVTTETWLVEEDEDEDEHPEPTGPIHGLEPGEGDDAGTNHDTHDSSIEDLNRGRSKE